MSPANNETSIRKVSSGISGFDILAMGGLPEGRATLVAGSSGSAKTIFGTQFLVTGVQHGEPAVFVTFEESPEDIRRNMLSFGWNIAEWEAKGLWLFVDGRPHQSDQGVVGTCCLEPLTIRIKHAVTKIKGRRLMIDSLGALLLRFPDQGTIRSEIGRVLDALKTLELTAIITAERVDEYGPISRDEVEAFVCDNVIVMRNVLKNESRNRSIEILKFRGTKHGHGETPFTISSNTGIAVLPPMQTLSSSPTDSQMTSGIKILDEMCGGGLKQGLITLLSGPSGSGKTLFAGHFAVNSQNDRCLYVSTEQGEKSLQDNFKGCGIDLVSAIKAQSVKFLPIAPESSSLIDHILQIQNMIDQFKPARLVIDSLVTFERSAELTHFKSFVTELSNYARERGILTLFTTTSSLTDNSSLMDDQILSVADAIILLRYIEVFGEVRRGITVLKIRGSKHDHGIREFTISDKGIDIGRAFRNVSGILAGTPTHEGTKEEERVESMFDQHKT